MILLTTLCALALSASAALGSSRVSALPFPEVPNTTNDDLPVVLMTTESPAQAIQQAIQSDPDVAKAVQDTNSTQQLYLLKTVSYATGTAADLDLPPEEELPDGAPDRVEEADITVYTPPVNNSSLSASEKSTNSESATSDGSPGETKLQLIPVSF